MFSLFALLLYCCVVGIFGGGSTSAGGGLDAEARNVVANNVAATLSALLTDCDHYDSALQMIQQLLTLSSAGTLAGEAPLEINAGGIKSTVTRTDSSSNTTAGAISVPPTTQATTNANANIDAVNGATTAATTDTKVVKLDGR